MKNQFSELYKNAIEKVFEIPDTPAFVYSESVLNALVHSYLSEIKDDRIRIHFATKSNFNKKILEVFKKNNIGLDVVSAGEIQLAQDLSFDPSRVVFSSVGKTRDEIRSSIEWGIKTLNVESLEELVKINEIATELKKKANVSVRFNPNIDVKTHPYIATGLSEHKFGLDEESSYEAYRYISENEYLNPVALSFHIGSQLFEMASLEEALERSVLFAKKIHEDFSMHLSFLDVGGGLGVDYTKPEELPNFSGYVAFLHKALMAWEGIFGKSVEIVSETGRALVSQAGFLLTKVIATKKNPSKDFLIVDASMTELIRPALYQSEHKIESLKKAEVKGPLINYEVVGQVCESADVLQKRVRLPVLVEDDLLVIHCAGAYGYVMSSMYNARPLAPIYWVEESGDYVLQRRKQLLFLD